MSLSACGASGKTGAGFVGFFNTGESGVGRARRAANPGAGLRALWGLAALVAMLLVPNCGLADPAPPTTKMLDADLVSPAGIFSGNPVYGTDTTHSVSLTAASTVSPEVKDLAQSLLGGRNIAVAADKNAFIQRVLEYVQNNINTEFRFGLSKGARGALIDQSGTPFDQAELMVALLRQGGVTEATYKVGTITLTAAQFGQWTGLVKGLNPGSQSFTVDARQACLLLADGGIPATVNGASSCASLTSDLTTVTMAHIWVAVGSNAYDPSYKVYTLKAGIDLPSAMGCGTETSSTCGSSVSSAAMTGATPGTQSGMPYVQNYNAGQGQLQVISYGTAIENYIKSHDRTAGVTDIVGGKDLNPQASQASLTRSVQATWSGDIPNPYRTLYVTSVMDDGNTTPQTYYFYADELSGRKLGWAHVEFIDGVAVGSPSGSSNYTPAAHTTRAQTLIGINDLSLIEVMVDHPYAAPATTGGAAGTYGDDDEVFKRVDAPTFELSVYRHFDAVNGPQGGESADTYKGSDYPEKSIAGIDPVVFIHSFGQASMTAQKNAADQNALEPMNNMPCMPQSTSDVIIVTCGDDNEGVLAETVNPLRTLTDHLVDGVSGAVTTRHHDVGIVYASRTPGNARITLQESLSEAAKTGNDADRQTAYNMQAITLSEVEGAVAPLDKGKQFSFASMFFSTTEGGFFPWCPNFFPCGQQWGGVVGNKIFDVAPTNMSAFLALQTDATPGTGTVYPPGLSCVATAQGCWRKTQLQNIASQGYSTIMMVNGQSEMFYQGANQRAYTIWEYMKGGGAVADPFHSVMQSTEVVDAASKARKELSVSAATGAMTYQAEPDIVSGAGDFPYSLPFVRTYTATYKERNETFDPLTPPRGNCGTSCTPAHHKYVQSMKSGGDSQFHDRLGGGWSHNYEVMLAISPDTSHEFGLDYALDASMALAQLRVMRDIASNTDLQSRLATIVAAMNFGYSEDAVVKMGGATDSFHVLPDGSLFSDQNPSAKLTVNRTDTPVTLTYTGPKGDSIHFSWYYLTSEDYNGNTGQPTGPSPGSSMPPLYKADSWTFPNGVQLTFNYNLVWMPTGYENSPLVCGNMGCGIQSMPIGYVLHSVSNNLGRSLTFHSTELTAQDSMSLGQEFRIDSVTDENGRTATFSLSGDCGDVSYSQGVATCNVFTATDANGLATRYEYMPLAGSSDPVPNRNNYQLRRIYTPGNPTAPFQSILYDDLSRVSTVTDRNGHVTTYYPAGINGAELYKNSEILAPCSLLGGTACEAGLPERTDIVYNDKNSDIKTVTAMGRTTLKTYNNAGWLLTATLPEGNGSQNTYDPRGNVLSVRNFAKPGSGLADINTSTTYVEPATTLICSNPVVCDSPASATDARGNVTNYTWNATTGDLTQVLLPADRTGTRPQTDLGYTTLAGISFMTSKTEKMSSSKSVVTSYAYNSANFYTLQSVTVDSAGLNLKTGLTFDSVGNLTAVDGPRVDVDDVTHYEWDPGRRIRAIITPDPDTGGAMQRKATRYTYANDPYGNDGLVTKTETGTTSATDVVTTPSNLAVTNYTLPAYDSMGNKTQEKVFDGSNNVLRITQTAFDADDRPVCSVLRMNLASTDTDACKQTGPEGGFGKDHVTKTVYDPDGAVIEIHRAVGITGSEQLYATYTYTKNGQKASEADANGNVTRLTYDGFDRLAGLYYSDPSVTRTAQPCAATAETWTGPTLPSSCSNPQSYTTRSTSGGGISPYLGLVSATDYETFGYDASGNKTSWRRRDGLSHTYQYDALNRQYLDDLPAYAGDGNNATAADVYTGYDLLGHICDKIFATDTQGTGTSDDCDARFSGSTAGLRNTYDKAGRLLQAKDVNGRILTYAYNVASTRASMTFPDGVVQAYSYNAGNMLTWTGINGTSLGVTPGYDPRGRLTTLTRSNTAVTTLTYDGLDRVLTMTHDLGGTTYDEMWTFAYNPASQIVSRTTTNTRFDYQEVHTEPDQNPTYDGQNRDTTVVSVSGYDANGNLTREPSPGTRQFTYDMDNRLLTASGGTQPIALTYDPVGRLASYSVNGGTPTTFLYDGVNLVAEYSGTSATAVPTARYLDGLGTDQPLIQFSGSGVTAASAQWLIADWQGSIIADTDQFGNESAMYHYDAYGMPANESNAWTWTGARFGYTGQTFLPDAQLYYYKARVYDPRYGRFLQTDPIGSKDNLDLYEYVGDDPMNRSDPTGLYTCEMEKMCKDLEADIQKLRDSLKGNNLTKEERGMVTTVVNAFGAAGEKNGLDVKFGSLGDTADGSGHIGGLTSQNDDGTFTITIDSSNYFRSKGTGPLHASLVDRLSVIVHEGSHVSWERDPNNAYTYYDGAPNYKQVYNNELNSYTNQNILLKMYRKDQIDVDDMATDSANQACHESPKDTHPVSCW